MTTVVIMPGGFHPFHAGHLELYNSARRTFPDAEVFVAATNDVSTRPFPFAVKEKLAKLAGVEPGHFVQVKSPFKAEEITSQFNPAQDRLIFVRSDKDAGKPPQAGGVKKDGSPAHLQPLLGAKKLEPFARHAYMAYLKTIDFSDILPTWVKEYGDGWESASKIRAVWPQLNDDRKIEFVMGMYPRTQGNPRLAATVVKMLDTAILGQVTEAVHPSKVIHPDKINIFINFGYQKPPKIIAANVPYELFDRYVAKVMQKYPQFKSTDFSFSPANSRPGVAEGEVIPLRRPSNTITWQEVPRDILLLANDWFWASEDDSGLDAVMDPQGYGSGTANDVRYITAKLQQKGWTIDHNDEYDDRFGPFHLRLTNRRGQVALLPIEDAQSFRGWAAGTNPLSENQGWAATLEEGAGTVLDLTKNFSNHARVHAEVVDVLPGGRVKLRVVIADTVPGKKPTVSVGQALSMAVNYLKRAPRVSESDMQTAGTPAVGGMTASYQRRENQPIDEDYIDEKWSAKYKQSINCARPRGFSQRAHCAGRKK